MPSKFKGGGQRSIAAVSPHGGHTIPVSGEAFPDCAEVCPAQCGGVFLILLDAGFALGQEH